MKRPASNTCSRRAGPRASCAPLWQQQSLGTANQGVDLECAGCGKQTSVTAGNRHAPLQAGADQLVLGGLSDGHPFQRHLGAATATPARLGSYKTAWLMCAKLRRSMVAPGRSPLAGLVEVDETEIACRSKHDPVTGGGGTQPSG